MPVKDAYRRRFAEAYFWYDVVIVKVGVERREVLNACRARAATMIREFSNVPLDTDRATWSTAGTTEALHYLRTACPACFATEVWGRTLNGSAFRPAKPLSDSALVLQTL